MSHHRKFPVDGIKIQDGVVGIPIAIVIDAYMSRNAVEIPVPHASGDGHSIPDVLALTECLVQSHAQEIDAIVEGSDEEIHLESQAEQGKRK